jgi:hypothetical protein
MLEDVGVLHDKMGITEKISVEIKKLPQIIKVVNYTIYPSTA